MAGLICCQSTALRADQTADNKAIPVEANVDHALVAGFERFYQHRAAEVGATELPAAGRLLLGELNCLSCHKTEGAVAEQISAKRAPHLDDVGNRLRVDAIRKLIANPHEAKPGTTMPDVLAGLPEAERSDSLEALVHFLAKTGGVQDTLADASAVKEGEKLFHQLGCVACHMPRIAPPPPVKSALPNFEEDEEPKLALPTTSTYVPLGDLEAKYTLGSLAKFLRDPLAVRPTARMPHFNLQEKEARQLASYFLKNKQVPPNVNFEAFEVGGLEKLPDFSKLKPKSSGVTSGLDLTVAGRANDFAVRFRGYLHLEKEGRYRFTIGSDDGSQVLVNGKKVVDVDGVHPHQEKNQQTILSAGTHEVVVEYFQGGGDWTLTLDVEGPGLSRQSVAGLLTPTPERKATSSESAPFVIDDTKAARGKALFASLGCASCHQFKDDGSPLQSEIRGPALAAMKGDGGCLSEQPLPAVPRYRLTDLQRKSLRSAILDRNPAPATPEQSIERHFLTFNCYACHARSSLAGQGQVVEKGGVEAVRNAYFESTIHEIGDEGRLPPSLTGAGDKLNQNYLVQIWDTGAKDRPYLKARMPKFSSGNLPDLATAFAKADERTDAKLKPVEESVGRMKSHGRVLMGDKGLSCVKCHPFNQYVEPGIQAINLNVMGRRLREDWFYRYMLEPAKYRPGTRMPGFYPGGKSVLDGVLGGDTGAQLVAMWTYLKDGSGAAIPSGLIKNPIVLKADKEPVIYRNFIDGLSPRGIAVGYPGGVNLAWDAERMNLGLIWQGAFIDASKHWNDRGPGFQIPLGDNVVQLAPLGPLARLADDQSPWPKESPRSAGYKFLGYRLNTAREPEFRYRLPGAGVTDFPQVVSDAGAASLRRTVTVNREPVADPSVLATGKLNFLAARGRMIKAAEGNTYVLPDGIRLTVESQTPARLRESAGEWEVVVPVDLESGTSRIVLSYRW